MNLMELQLRLAGHAGAAVVKVKVTGPVDAEGCAELTCVETVTEGRKQWVVLSDARG